MKTALVLGAGGFIGSHLVNQLKKEGYWVRGIDLKYPEFSKSQADEFFILDLRNIENIRYAFDLNNINKTFDEVYQLAADMGGAGYLFTGSNDANIMSNSVLINVNVLTKCSEQKPGKIFYSSSACVYPKRNQENAFNPKCTEDSTYPADPDSEYGWEKLFSERLYLSFAKDYGIDIRIARFHGIFGPEGTWFGGKEKAPAAICRKIAEANDNDTIEIWGDGEQTRSFLYIDECVEAVRRFMKQNKFTGPVNIGSEKMITINDLTKKIIGLSGKNIGIKNVIGPVGVRGRNSDNKLFKKYMDWSISDDFDSGIQKTYKWIKNQVEIHKNK